MPQVPIVLPSVQPQSSAGGGYLSTQDPAMAFGAGIGQEQQRLGQTIERTGDMLQKHATFLQDRANQAEATDKFVEWDKEAAGLQTWHRQQQGTNAVATLPELYKKQDELREKYIQSMPNVEVRRMFDQDSKRRLAYMIQDSGLYAANQNKASNVRAANSRQSLAIQQAGNSQTDDEFLFNLESAQKGVDAESMELGWTPEETKVKREAVASKVYQSRIDTIAMTDPFRAQDIYKTNKEKILDPATRMHIEQNLLRQYNNVGTRYDADSIVNGTGFKDFPNVGGTHRDAIAAVESGGRYDAEGPVVTKGRFAGQRGIGKYQMMEDNVRDWTKEVLGKEMTPAEFKKDKEAQDTVFDAKFGQLLDKYGNFQDAASAWHSGRPLAEAIKAGATDSYSKTEDYVKRATAALGTGATGPLTTESDAGWLKGAIDRAKAIAQARAPDNPQYEDTLITRVKSEYANVKTVRNETLTANYNTVIGSITQLDQTGKPTVTSMDAIFSNPVLNDAYNALSETRQAAIRDRVVKNSRADVPLTQERWNRFQELNGLAVNDPRKFVDTDIVAEDMPRTLQGQLLEKQRRAHKNALDNAGLTRAISSITPMLNDAGIRRSATDPATAARYNQAIGAFETERDQWIKDNGGKLPSPQENQKILSGVLKVTNEDRWFFQSEQKKFEVPEGNRTEIVQAFTKRYGKPPTAAEVYTVFQRQRQRETNATQ